MKSDPTCISMQCARFILCYVDGLMLSDDKKAVADLVADLQKELLLRVSGELSESGRRMRRTSMFMQTSYVDRILEQAATPLD